MIIYVYSAYSKMTHSVPKFISNLYYNTVSRDYYAVDGNNVFYVNGKFMSMDIPKEISSINFVEREVCFNDNLEYIKNKLNVMDEIIFEAVLKCI